MGDHRDFNILAIIFFLLLLAHPTISDVSKEGNNSLSVYSLVHLSDTQNLASFHPEVYNHTFSYLESIKDVQNISAIIITGDLVNTYDNETEWNAYRNAINKTSIPVYATAGNHDTAYGLVYSFFSQYTGNTKPYSVTSLNDFNLVSIDYSIVSLASHEFQSLREKMDQYPHSFTLIATHHYMEPDGSLSLVGEDIDKELIRYPTLVMAGHRHVQSISTHIVDQYPVIVDIANYQDGDSQGKNRTDHSAGTLFTVTSRNGVVEKISSRVIRIFPDPVIGQEHVVYEL